MIRFSLVQFHFGFHSKYVFLIMTTYEGMHNITINKNGTFNIANRVVNELKMLRNAGWFWFCCHGVRQTDMLFTSITYPRHGQMWLSDQNWVALRLLDELAQTVRYGTFHLIPFHFIILYKCLPQL